MKQYAKFIPSFLLLLGIIFVLIYSDKFGLNHREKLIVISYPINRNEIATQIEDIPRITHSCYFQKRDGRRSDGYEAIGTLKVKGSETWIQLYTDSNHISLCYSFFYGSITALEPFECFHEPRGKDFFETIASKCYLYSRNYIPIVG